MPLERKDNKWITTRKRNTLWTSFLLKWTAFRQTRPLLFWPQLTGQRFLMRPWWDQGGSTGTLSSLFQRHLPGSNCFSFTYCELPLIDNSLMNWLKVWLRLLWDFPGQILKISAMKQPSWLPKGNRRLFLKRISWLPWTESALEFRIKVKANQRRRLGSLIITQDKFWSVFYWRGKGGYLRWVLFQGGRESLWISS